MKARSLAFALMLVLSVGIASAAQPNSIGAACQFVDSLGKGIVGATVNISIYDAASGGTPIYTEIFTDATDSAGRCTFGALGQSSDIPVTKGQTYYLDMEVNGEDYNWSDGFDRKEFNAWWGPTEYSDLLSVPVYANASGVFDSSDVRLATEPFVTGLPVSTFSNNAGYLKNGATALDAFAVGSGATATGYSTGVGDYARAEAFRTTSLGANTRVTSTAGNSIALGYGATNSQADSLLVNANGMVLRANHTGIYDANTAKLATEDYVAVNAGGQDLNLRTPNGTAIVSGPELVKGPGTVSMNINSPLVTGVGTDFSTNAVLQDTWMIRIDGKPYLISNIINDTALELGDWSWNTANARETVSGVEWETGWVMVDSESTGSEGWKSQIALGGYALASRKDAGAYSPAIAIGYDSYVVGTKSLAIGWDAAVDDAIQGTSVGTQSVVYQDNGIALGAYPVSDGVNAVAMGTYTTSNATGAVAIGRGTAHNFRFVNSQPDSFVFGKSDSIGQYDYLRANATGVYDSVGKLATESYVQANAGGSVGADSIGDVEMNYSEVTLIDFTNDANFIDNDAAGGVEALAAGVGASTATAGGYAVAFGSLANAGESAVAIGADSVALTPSAIGSVAIGNMATSENGGVSIGLGVGSAERGVAIGGSEDNMGNYIGTTAGNSAVAVGYKADASMSSGIAIGSEATLVDTSGMGTDIGSVAIGPLTTASGSDVFVIGSAISNSQPNSLVFGTNSAEHMRVNSTGIYANSLRFPQGGSVTSNGSCVVVSSPDGSNTVSLCNGGTGWS